MKKLDVPAINWKESLPLLQESPLLDYPISALPKAIKDAVCEVLAFVQAPVPLVAASALTTLSLAAQHIANVERTPGLSGPISLNFLSLAESGERKTSCDNLFGKPLHEYEIRVRQERQAEYQKYTEDLKLWETKKAKLEKKIAAEFENGRTAENHSLRLDNLITQKPIPPMVPRLLHVDITPEQLAHNLAKVWHSTSIISSESGSVFGSHGMKHDSILSSLSQFNILWDGGHHSIDRRTSESLTINNARLTIGLQVQEATLKNFIDRTGELIRGVGFLARCLISWPQSTQGTRLFRKRSANSPALDTFHKRIIELLDDTQSIKKPGDLDCIMLKFNPKAKEVWINFHNSIEVELKDDGEYFEIKDFASKSADNVARLAALFHIFEGKEGEISANSIESACDIIRWHLNEAKRFCSSIAIPPHISAASKLSNWLIQYCQKHNVVQVNKRLLQNRGPNCIRDPKKLKDALQTLIDANHIHVEEAGRSTEIYLNPSFYNSEK